MGPCQQEETVSHEWDGNEADETWRRDVRKYCRQNGEEDGEKTGVNMTISLSKTFSTIKK